MPWNTVEIRSSPRCRKEVAYASELSLGRKLWEGRRCVEYSEPEDLLLLAVIILSEE